MSYIKLEMAHGGPTVVVESSFIVLSSKEFQQFAQRFGGINEISQVQATWTRGESQIIDADIESTTIEFGKPVSLKALKQAVDASQFRYSLDHYRRPGQPIGTSIDTIDAQERAQQAANRESGQAKAPVKQQGPAKTPYVPFPVDPIESTAMKVNTGKREIPYVLQLTEEGLWYVDYPDFDPKTQSYKDYRIQGPDGTKVKRAAETEIQKIKQKLSA